MPPLAPSRCSVASFADSAWSGKAVAISVHSANASSRRSSLSSAVAAAAQPRRGHLSFARIENRRTQEPHDRLLGLPCGQGRSDDEVGAGSQFLGHFGDRLLPGRRQLIGRLKRRGAPALSFGQQGDPWIAIGRQPRKRRRAAAPRSAVDSK